MNLKVQGIVLNAINYNDKYLLVQIYTDILGRVTYMVSKSNSKSSKVRRYLFSPLSLLEMEVEHRDARDIQRIKEARLVYPMYSISMDMGKTSVAFFMAEFLTRVLKDSGENRNLFDFLSHSIQILELSNNSIANYHLVFMVRMTRFMGFYPNLEDYKQGQIFDMLNGLFVSRQPLHKHYVSAAESLALSRLARISYENMHVFKFSRQDRVSILNRILDYYRIHLNDFPALKSLDVLHELF